MASAPPIDDNEIGKNHIAEELGILAPWPVWRWRHLVLKIFMNGGEVLQGAEAVAVLAEDVGEPTSDVIKIVLHPVDISLSTLDGLFKCSTPYSTLSINERLQLETII